MHLIEEMKNMYFTTPILPVINSGCDYGLTCAKRWTHYGSLVILAFCTYELLLSSSYGFVWRNIPSRVGYSQFHIFFLWKECRFISWLTYFLTIEMISLLHLIMVWIIRNFCGFSHDTIMFCCMPKRPLAITLGLTLYVWIVSNRHTYTCLDLTPQKNFLPSN